MHRKELWPFLFFLGVMSVNYPILEMVRIPMPYYLYGTWIGLILVIAVATAIAGTGEDDDHG
jgi:hypothetical protein